MYRFQALWGLFGGHHYLLNLEFFLIRTLAMTQQSTCNSFSFFFVQIMGSPLAMRKKGQTRKRAGALLSIDN